MICERVKEQMPEYLGGQLEGEAREKFIVHLEQCARCRSEVEELGALWRRMDLLPQAQPSPAMRGRFMEMLEAYQFGLEQSSRPKRASWWLPKAPWQTAAAAFAMLVVGIAVGRSGTGGGTEIKQLKGEMEGMRQLVTLSLLQQQSANARLRGVNYSYQMERPDPQVENALLYAVNHDNNVNVRLSAVDALQKFARLPEVSQALIDAIPSQDSPLVQIALIDMLVQLNDGTVAPALRKLADDPNANQTVRQRAEWGLRKLGVS